MPAKQVSLDFPLDGLNRRAAYQKQPPTTTPDAQNVWPTDTFDRRERGGSRPGLKKTSAVGGPAAIQCLSSVYTVSTAGVVTENLVMISNGVIYSDTTGTLTALSATASSLLIEAGTVLETEASVSFDANPVSLASDLAAIQAAENGQKLYIADLGPIRHSNQTTGGTVATTTLDDSGVSDWTTYGIIALADVAEVTYVSGTAVTGTYEILSLDAGSVTLSATAGTGNCKYRITRGPKIYDPVAGTLAPLLSTTGQVPLGCPLVAFYRNRLVLAGPDHVWYMSRQADPTDWNYGADPNDPSRAVAGQLSTAGTPGTPIIAIIPHSDDYLVFGCSDTLWILKGDPAYGGQLDVLSRGIGIVGPNAWCRLPDSTLMFLSKDGLYSISPGSAGSYPIPVSREFIPEELLDVNTTNNLVSMAYDNSHGGVLLSITPTDGSTGSHYWIQIPSAEAKRAQSFWPIVHQDAHQPCCLYKITSSTTLETSVLLGCNDGYIRQYDDATTTDDGYAFNSFVTYGPFRIGGDDYNYGLVSELVGTTDVESDDVVWSLYTANTTAEAVNDPNLVATGVWEAGRNANAHPRLSGGAFVLKVYSSGRFAMEDIIAGILPRGKQRL